MKKLLSILLAFVLMFSLVSCGEIKDSDNKEKFKNQEVKKEEKKTDKQLVEETVKGFFDDLSELNFGGMKSYLSDSTSLPEEFNAYNLDELVDETFSSLPAEAQGYIDEGTVKTYIESVLNKMKGYISYEIADITKANDEEYKAVVNLTLPDPESSNANEVLGEYMTEEGTMTLLQQLYEEGTITEESTQDEILGALMLKIFTVATEAIDEVEFKTVTNSAEYIVVKNDAGKWLIKPPATAKE